MTKINEYIYRGFCRAKTEEGREKEANEKFRLSIAPSLPTWTERKNCTNVIAVFKKPYGMLDFDNVEDWNIVVKIVKDLGLKLALKNGRRGGHLYGKFPAYYMNHPIKNVTDKCNAIGLRGDIKQGHTNSVDSVKRGDVIMTEFDYNGDLDDLDEIPKWLMFDKIYFPLETRGKGGRDNTIHARRGLLAKLGYTKDEILNVLNIINKYVFDEPLEQDTINNKVTDELLEEDKKNFKLLNNTTFLNDKGNTIEEPRKMAEYLFNKYHVCNYTDRLYFYDGEKYTDNQEVLKDLISEEYPKLKNGAIVEQIKLIESISYRNVKKENELGYIRFDNGVVDLTTGELLGKTADYFVTNHIPHKYLNTHSEWGEFFFNHVTNGERDTQTFLFEVLGRCLWNRPIDAEAVIITGEGGNGKTTYIKMIQNALGDDNFQPTQWGELGKGFATDDGRNALAITSDELNANTFDETGFFFEVSSGGVVKGNAKYGQRSSYRFKAMLLSACNDLPKLTNLELMTALARRLIIIKFRKNLKLKENRIPNLKREMEKESFLQWFLYQAVQHFTKVIETDEYTIPTQAEENMLDYQRDVDKLNLWVKSLNVEQLENFTLTDINNRFTDYLNGEYFPRKKGDMSKAILKYHHLTLKTVNGQRKFIQLN